MVVAANIARFNYFFPFYPTHIYKKPAASMPHCQEFLQAKTQKVQCILLQGSTAASANA